MIKEITKTLKLTIAILGSSQIDTVIIFSLQIYLISPCNCNSVLIYLLLNVNYLELYNHLIVLYFYHVNKINRRLIFISRIHVIMFWNNSVAKLIWYYF